jgi:hypothetical protein
MTTEQMDAFLADLKRTIQKHTHDHCQIEDVGRAFALTLEDFTRSMVESGIPPRTKAKKAGR